jgi:hypothetical protein
VTYVIVPWRGLPPEFTETANGIVTISSVEVVVPDVGPGKVIQDTGDEAVQVHPVPVK